MRKILAVLTLAFLLPGLAQAAPKKGKPAAKKAASVAKTTAPAYTLSLARLKGLRTETVEGITAALADQGWSYTGEQTDSATGDVANIWDYIVTNEAGEDIIAARLNQGKVEGVNGIVLIYSVEDPTVAAAWTKSLAGYTSSGEINTEEQHIKIYRNTSATVMAMATDPDEEGMVHYTYIVTQAGELGD